ncbi:MAG: hypothetical protein V4678_03130 [Patescibacteria group bacterium]
MKSHVNEFPPGLGVKAYGEIDRSEWDRQLLVTYEMLQDFNLLDEAQQQEVFGRLLSAFGTVKDTHFAEVVESMQTEDRETLHRIILDMLHGAKNA